MPNQRAGFRSRGTNGPISVKQVWRRAVNQIFSQAENTCQMTSWVSRGHVLTLTPLSSNPNPGSDVMPEVTLWWWWRHGGDDKSDIMDGPGWGPLTLTLHFSSNPNLKALLCEDER